MTTQRDDLISWLNDAYALEVSLEEVLKNHIKDAKDQPQIRQKIEAHAEQTRQHAQKMKQCIEALGGSVSTTKAVWADISGRMQGMYTGMFSDELVKNMLMEFTSENFEIASYTSLIAAAEELGEASVASVCREVLRDEQQMADWIKEQIPMVTKAHLRARGMKAAA